PLERRHGGRPHRAQDYRRPEALRQLQREEQPVLFLLFDAVPGGGRGPGGGPRTVPHSGEKPRPALLHPAGALSPGLPGAKKTAAIKEISYGKAIPPRPAAEQPL